MITTFLLSVINFLWYGFLELFTFSNLPGIPLSSFSGAVNNLWNVVGPIASFINTFVPLYLLFTLAGSLAFAFMVIFLFQGARFLLGFLPTKPGS